jgi:cell division protein ZapE
MSKSILTPMSRYQKDIDDNDFTSDVAQLAAIKQLDILFHELINNENRSHSLLSRIFGRKPASIQGLYLWGGVGRGKTYLMDSFYDVLPITKKKRLHFHRFMYWVHHELNELKSVSDPLEVIASKLASETHVLCFDEFFVSDIGDAMILGGLLQAMFNHGISLVATSNIPPEKLYRNGLQRERFLPVIELIKQHTQTLNVDGGVDYRLRTLEQAEIYHSPLDLQAEKNLHFSFSNLAVDAIEEGGRIIINGREIKTRYRADGIVWLDFKSICDSPRSARDYIELSRLYHSVLISSIPQLNDGHNDSVRRFISLVDEFYERHVKLIVSAEAPLSTLYMGSALAFEFERTQSRLLEMQSHDYLALEHLP